MFRTSRYFDKNDRPKNFFGEEDYIEVKNGQVKCQDFSDSREPPKKSEKKPKRKSR